MKISLQTELILKWLRNETNWLLTDIRYHYYWILILYGIKLVRDPLLVITKKWKSLDWDYHGRKWNNLKLECFVINWSKHFSNSWYAKPILQWKKWFTSFHWNHFVLNFTQSQCKFEHDMDLLFGVIYLRAHFD